MRSSCARVERNRNGNQDGNFGDVISKIMKEGGDRSMRLYIIDVAARPHSKKRHSAKGPKAGSAGRDSVASKDGASAKKSDASGSEEGDDEGSASPPARTLVERKGQGDPETWQVSALEQENARLREAVEEMVKGPDRFLAKLNLRLTAKQRDLFFALMCRGEEGGVSRFLSYETIGKRMKPRVTRQAIGERVKKLYALNPTMEIYVKELRKPAKAVAFSVLSPHERDKKGIDKCYGYEAR